jgi:1-deoxy-D-xylulose-5-phosphate synthase
MNLLSREMPDRFYDVGIEEEHAVTFSAGLAAGGLKPFCNIYSSFSQRAYDQIIHDVALQDLPVVLCLDRGGLVGEDGATHHGCYDMSIYRSIPGAVIAAPSDEIELKDMMYSAMMAQTGPYIIRYPRGYGEGADWQNHKYSQVNTGEGELLVPGSGVAVICAGPVANRAREAALRLKEETGWTPAIYNIRYIKPIDENILECARKDFKEVVTIEDGTVIGGLHGAVAEYMSSYKDSPRVTALGIPDRYIGQGTQAELRQECCLTEDGIHDFLAGLNEKNLKKD